jgi:putative aldouronate transport system permease protein
MTKRKPAETAANAAIRFLMILALAATLYPFIYVVSMSISDPQSVMRGEVWLLPRGFSVESYRTVLKQPAIWTAYGNTLFYAVAGTALNVAMTFLGSYVLSRPQFFLRRAASLAIVFTMFFSGGLIPLFLLVRKLGIYNTRWAMILPTAASAYFILIGVTFLRTVPESLHESARLDGANDLTILVRVVIPLSLPLLSTLALFYAVEHWNSYFNALVFLADERLKPLQVFLVRVLVQADYRLMEGITDNYERTRVFSQLKYCVIVVSILPIVLAYPFLQKYFVKGVMIGAIKE